MTPTELRDHCRRQMEIIESDDARVLLTLPGRWRSDTKRLAGRSGPSGRCIADTPKGVLVEFYAREVLAWLDRHAPAPAEGGEG
ncbi:MAG TPA: hypothetical protein VN033_08845 [Vulgatibacter sp.]|nr:hypothetical protein [Vulgatibacter sp.]